MRRMLLRPALGMLGLTQVRHVSPVRRRAARGLVATVYREVERDFGVLAPPMALHSPSPEMLAAAWLMLRETLLAHGQVDRAVKEAVATQVSADNACPYCAIVHEDSWNGLRGLASPTPADPGDPALAAIRAWALAGPAGVTDRHPPFPAQHTAELVGVTVMMQYLNRMVNVLLRDVPLPPGVPRFALGPVMRLLGGLLGGAARTLPAPGISLELLPGATLPADMSWALGNAQVASAFARAHAAVERAGRASVPAAVRELVLSELAAWQGESRGMSRSWVEDAIRGLSPADQAAGRLALLVAFASYQVDDTVIERFRRVHSGDQTLVELCAWTALTAARWIGTRMPAAADRVSDTSPP